MNERMKMIANIAFSYAKMQHADLKSLLVRHEGTGKFYYEYGEATFDTLEGDIKIIIRDDGSFERV